MRRFINHIAYHPFEYMLLIVLGGIAALLISFAAASSGEKETCRQHDRLRVKSYEGTFCVQLSDHIDNFRETEK